jgi:hypothetical protein
MASVSIARHLPPVAMSNIPKIILRRYLGGQSPQARLAQFNYLSRYSWLGDILNELEPELFPKEAKAEATVEVIPETAPDEVVLQILDTQVRGQRGIYRVDHWLSQRGTGYLFTGTQVGANQPVVVKEFLLPSRLFNEEEAAQHQQAFVGLAGVALADGRVQDSRIMAPLEAIADVHTYERCYLVTDARDASPTLRQYLSTVGPLDNFQVREVLDQSLQSLIFLHQQRFVLPAGQMQTGLVHGNLSLDSLLWVEPSNPQTGQPFVYLCDLALWENLFVPAAAAPPPHTVAQDLRDLGQVAFWLLLGAERPDTPPTQGESWPDSVDPDLKLFIQRLLALAPPFESAAAAREALRNLPQPPILSDVAGEAAITPSKRRFPWLGVGIGVIALLLLAGLGWWVWQRWGRQAAIAQPSLCCLKDVSAVPEGQFLYTAVEGSTWSQIAREAPTDLGLPSLGERLDQDQPGLRLNFEAVNSIEEAVFLVDNQRVDFAVIPLVGDIPPSVAVDVIAYDALAVLVSYSYAQRQQGLPRSLGGDISLDQVRGLYAGEFFSWRDLGGVDLPVRLYAPESPEAQALFFQLLYLQADLQPQPPAADVTPLPTLEMLRTVIRDFEEEQVGGVGFAPLSQISGQCSIYPLGLQAPGQGAVQPLALITGEPVDPQVDLCDRKGQYGPNLAALESGDYPLAYPIAVIYPLDNRLPPVGRKFAELMLTDEGQQFLWQKGFVPVNQEAARVTPRRISEQNEAN